MPDPESGFITTACRLARNAANRNCNVSPAYPRAASLIEIKPTGASSHETTGIKTQREALELGLRTLLRLRQQTEHGKLRGKYEWVGDRGAMSRDG